MQYFSYLLKSNVEKCARQNASLGTYTLFFSLNHRDNHPHRSILAPCVQQLPQDHPANAAIRMLDEAYLSTFFDQSTLDIAMLAEDSTTMRIAGGVHLPHLFIAAHHYRDTLQTTLQQFVLFDDHPQWNAVCGQLRNLLAQLSVLDYFSEIMTSTKSVTTTSIPSTDPRVHRLAEVQRGLRGQRWQDVGLPLPAIDWPKNRHGERYNQLHYRRLFRTKNNDALHVPLNQLPPASIIFDAGMGEGNALRDYKNAENFTVGVTLHLINPANDPYVDLLAYTSIPEGTQAQKLFTLLRGRVKCVIDTYGPGTYAKNPIHALIYLGELLEEEGVATIIVSSVLGENSDQCPLGYANTRRQLPKFFKKTLHLDLQIARTFIDSAVSKGPVCIDYHVEIRRAQHAPASPDSLTTLLQLADRYFGVPHDIPKSTSWGNFGFGLNIHGKCYLETMGDARALTSATDWQAALAAVQLDYARDAGLGIRFHLSFTQKAATKIFATQFLEYFVHHHNRDWQCALNKDIKTVDIVYFDKDTDEKAIKQHFAVRVAAQSDIPWECVIANDVAANFKPVTPAYSTTEVAMCYQSARQQLQGLFDLPGVTDLTEADLPAEGEVKTLYQQTGYQPFLFPLPKIQREFSRFQNQYMNGVGVPITAKRAAEAASMPAMK